MERTVGMYVFQQWVYHHPYCVKRWTLGDWLGYARGLNELGYNALLMWPLLETMPDPLTPSDVALLEKLEQVIDFAHEELGMRVYLVLTPNIVADDAAASRYPFEGRPFFQCDLRVDPDDLAAMEEMLGRRARSLAPLSVADGVAVIDSDPGGYPGSTNAEFVELLVSHRRMLDGLRPGIELLYWIHAGWEAYGRFYETGRFAMGTDEEVRETLTLLREADPEPWGLLGARTPGAEELGLASRVLRFPYGAIEGEPSFPLTGFGEDRVVAFAQAAGARGVMGNAQTHCVQLPNTFAFARGSGGHDVSRSDYVAFADRLAAGLGDLVVRGWEALAGGDVEQMRTAASELAAADDRDVGTGDLGGLVFGDAGRFVGDLVLQLQFQAASDIFCRAAEENGDMAAAFPDLAVSLTSWQERHGYSAAWKLPKLGEALAKLPSAAVQEALEPRLPQAWARGVYDPAEAATPYECVRATYQRLENQTARVVAAVSAHLRETQPAASVRPSG